MSTEPSRYGPRPEGQRVLPQNPTGDDAAHEGPRGHDHALKDHDTFAVLGHGADINPRGDGEQGVYSSGTRFVSRLALEVNGRAPLLLSSGTRDDNTALVTQLINPEVRDGDLVLERGVLQLTRTACVREGCFYEELVVRSHSPRPLRVPLRYRLDADFADVFELRGVSRLRRGERGPREVGGDRIQWRYRGLDEATRITSVQLSPAPTRFDDEGACFDLELSPRGSARLVLRVCCQVGDAPVVATSWEEAVAELAEQRRAHEEDRCVVTSDDPLLNRWLERSTADLAMLSTELPEGRVAYAGLPWLATVLGRDALLTALFASWHDPGLARGTLTFFAATQAKTYDARRDAEPGKIIHELRAGEMAALGEVPFGRYYGSVDATPLFVVLAGAYYQATGDLDLIAELWPSVFRAASWLDVCGDIDGDGFIEYRPSAEGLVNQGWKSSPDAIVHRDGSVAVGPIALVEVQAYAYAAKLQAARLANELGDRGQAEKLTRDAALLRAAFDKAYWCEELSTYALALDGNKKRCEVRASNAAHALTFPIALPNRVDVLARSLLEDDLFSGWGLRTLSSREVAYNPTSYHNGSVWPHECALLALGLSRWGYTQLAAKVMDAMLDASALLERHRLPELLCGFERDHLAAPTPFPSACSPQAWSAAAPFALLAATLGMRLEAQSGRLLFQHPTLPKGVKELELRNLRLGEARVDLFIHRQREHVGVSVTRLEGPGEVVIIP